MNSKFLFWTPRVFTILLIFLLVVLSFDAFSGEDTLGEMILGFLIHNVPTILFIIVLALSWSRPKIGGVLFIFAGFLYMFFMRNSEDKLYEAIFGSLMLAGPVIICGILFLLDSKINKRGWFSTSFSIASIAQLLH